MTQTRRCRFCGQEVKTASHATLAAMGECPNVQ